MSPFFLQNLLVAALQLYMYLLFGYVIASWFEHVSWVRDIRRALTPLCEPYLQVFRRVVPPMGGLDFSPAVAIIVLSFVRNLIVRL